jgi:hypothetical protein
MITGRDFVKHIQEHEVSALENVLNVTNSFEFFARSQL